MRLKDAPYDIAQYTSPQKILEQLILLTVGHSLLADNLLEAEMYILEDIDHELKRSNC